MLHMKTHRKRGSIESSFECIKKERKKSIIFLAQSPDHTSVQQKESICLDFQFLEVYGSVYYGLSSFLKSMYLVFDKQKT